MKEQQYCFWNRRFVGGMPIRALRGACSLLAVICVLLSPSVANANEQSFDIEIPASNAADALNLLAQQTDAIMLFPYDLARTRQANPVSGRMTVAEALQVLLDGTGLSGGLSDKRVIQIALDGTKPQDEGRAMPTRKVPMRRKVTGVIAAAFLTTGAIAQDDQNTDDIDTDTDIVDIDDARDGVEEIVVTGSRLRRTTFDSISPLQLIDANVSRDVGLTEVSESLQLSVSAAGGQIDNTFTAFVLDNGPGSQTIDLRGLGASRTLVLLNGRRLAPSGVEGAPASPSVNFIPSGLVDRTELLLDGASGVYGSDAVAGVTNVILRKDFGGPEFYVFGDQPGDGNGGGERLNATFTIGKTFDRGFVGLGVDYFRRGSIQLRERDFLSNCERHLELGTDGSIRSLDISRTEQFAEYGINYPSSECTLAGVQSRRIFASGLGSNNIWFSGPGAGNLGTSGFSLATLFGAPVDFDGDTNADVVFNDFTINGNNLDATFVPSFERINVMSYGEFTFDGDAEITPYYEALYTNLESNQPRGFRSLPIFPSVPASNPYNLCNPSNPGGIDCGLAYDDILLNENVGAVLIQMFPDFYDENGDGTPTIDEYRSISQGFAFGSTPNGVPLIPVVSVRGDRDNTLAEIEQYRFVAGVRGNVPFLDNVGSLDNWSFDASLSYSTSEGFSSRRGIRGDRLEYSIANTTVDASGNIVCPGRVEGDTLDCVPVNIFAPSLYATNIGDFASQEERDYLFDDRNFDTTYEQTVFSAYVTGDLFELPAGPLAAVVGGEYRVDEIDSRPDAVARDGLFFGFFSDQGASGDRWTREYFAEIGVPILADLPFASSLDVELAGRHTTDEFFGSDTTYSAKLGWRPIDSLLLRGTVGTSFRAPNVRENFLRSQTSFFTIFDPCTAPEGGDGPGGADEDLRDPEILENCRQQGIDPTTFNAGGFGYSVETAAGGAQDITEETSDAYSAGLSFRQPFFEAFDLVLGATYYEIDIQDTIIEPSAQFIINDCLVANPNLSSAFCSRITRDADGFIDFIDAGFINQDQELARGVDVNVAYTQEFDMFNRPSSLNVRLDGNRNLERRSVFVDENGNSISDQSVGEFGFPKWRAQGTVTLRWGDSWTASWFTRYVGSVEQDEEFVDPFSDVFDTNETGFTGQTCRGIANGDIDCRDIGFADDYFVHTLSASWSSDRIRITAGIRNLFDDTPPLVDGNEVFSVSNVPIGNGYDFDGRTFYASASYRFYD